MFYMRPSRYFPNHTPTQTIIDNLCYVINTMLENNPSAQQHGIGFLASMDDWKMQNFDVPYCYQFMMALQGFMVPVKTQLFLIVNPPKWFGVVWKIMKPMLAPSFRKRVKICPEFQMAKYLAPGYQTFLPNDMKTGQANTDAMVVDFIAYRQYVEQGSVHHGYCTTTHSHSHSGGGEDFSVSHSHTSGSMEDGSFRRMLDASMGRFSTTSSSEDNQTTHSSEDNSRTYRPTAEEEDGASIHCDIDDDPYALENVDEEENENEESGDDTKPAATVHISNLPCL
jgi:CRAL/TRIO domain